MARGDLTIFNEALGKMLEGNWASTDRFYIAICDNTTTPVASTATPTLSDFTEVGTAGTYAAGGYDIGDVASNVSVTGDVVTFASIEVPDWLADASNDTDAYWGIIYNYTDAAHDALAFLDLGGPVDMSVDRLTINWNASGIFSIEVV